MQQLISKLAFQLRLRLNEMEWIGMIYFVCSLGSIELYVADWFMALAHSLYCIESSRFLSLLLLHYGFLSSVLLLFSFIKPFFMTICGFTSILSFASGMELWAFRISSLSFGFELCMRFVLLYYRLIKCDYLWAQWKLKLLLALAFTTASYLRQTQTNWKENEMRERRNGFPCA